MAPAQSTSHNDTSLQAKFLTTNHRLSARSLATLLPAKDSGLAAASPLSRTVLGLLFVTQRVPHGNNYCQKTQHLDTGCPAETFLTSMRLRNLRILYGFFYRFHVCRSSGKSRGYSLTNIPARWGYTNKAQHKEV